MTMFRRKKPRSTSRRRRLFLEQLEDRRMLTTEIDSYLTTWQYFIDELGNGSLDDKQVLADSVQLHIHDRAWARSSNGTPIHPMTDVGPANGRLNYEFSITVQDDYVDEDGNRGGCTSRSDVSVACLKSLNFVDDPVHGTFSITADEWPWPQTDGEKYTSAPRVEGVGGNTDDDTYIEINTYYVFEYPELSGVVYLDENANGRRDPGEGAFDGQGRVGIDANRDGDYSDVYSYEKDQVSAEYARDNGTKQWGREDHAATNANGEFLLDEVHPAPDGIDIIFKSSLKTSESGSSYAPYGQTSKPIMTFPTSGLVREGLEIGVFELAKASGVFFVDENGNGVQDEGEVPRHGLRVFFDANDDGILNDDEPSALTGNDGSFFLAGGMLGSKLRVRGDHRTILRAEDYVVSRPGQSFEGHFALFDQPSISGVVFEDTDLNGEFDHFIDNDQVSPVAIVLDLHDDGTIDRITHSFLSGVSQYRFHDVPLGTHSVRPSLLDQSDLTVPADVRGQVFTVGGSDLPLAMNLGYKPGAEFVEPTIEGDAGSSCGAPGGGAEGEDPFGSCKPPDQELIQRKTKLYHFTLDQIDEFERSDSEAASDLRKLAVRIARVEDGVPTAPLDNLLKLEELVHQRLLVNGAYGKKLTEDLAKFVDDFDDGVADDLAQLIHLKEQQFDKLVAKLWDADKLAILESLSSAAGGFLITTLKEFRDLVGDMLEPGTFGILYDMTAKALKETDFKRLAVETLGLYEIEKGMDPNITFDQRLVHMFSGIFSLADSVSFAGDLKDGAGYLATSTARKVQEHLRKQARKVAHDPALASKYATFASEVFEAILKRKKGGKPTSFDYLADGEIIPASMLREIGWTDEAIADLQRIAKECNCDLSFRTTNVDSAHHLKENRAVTKPKDIKQKTIGEYDEALGFDASDRGLVGMKSADEMTHPSKAAPCLPPKDVAECDWLTERYNKRVAEYNEFIGDYTLVDSETGTYRHKDFDATENAKPYVFKDGKIYDASDPNDLRPIAGDIDPVSFVDRETGKEIVGDRYDELVETFNVSDAQGQHGASQHIVRDTRKSLEERGISPDSPQYQKEMAEAFELRLKLQKGHKNLSETTIKVSPDGLQMNRRFQENGFLDIDEAGNVIDPLLGTDVRRALHRMGRIAIRETLLRGGPKAVRDTVGHLNAALRERIDRLTEALGESAFFSADEFGEMSSEDFQTLCDSEPNGIILRNANKLLTLLEILERYAGSQQPQDGGGEGEGGSSGGLVVTPIEGGFHVMSKVARERFLDNNGDGIVSPSDALNTINNLIENGSHELPEFATLEEVRQDANVDNVISPIDLLTLINFIRDNSSGGSSAGEGEASGPSFAAPSSRRVSLTGVSGGVTGEVDANDTAPVSLAADGYSSTQPLIRHAPVHNRLTSERPDAWNDSEFWSSPIDELTLDLLTVD